MEKIKCLLLIFVLSFLFLLPPNSAQAEKFTIVTTFTILEDFVQQIAGEKADVRVLCPVGAEIHEWELTPQNFMDLEQADIVFYNGLNVEQWMGQVRATIGESVPVIPVGEVCNFPTLPIVTGDFAGDPDPHIWMDVCGAIAYVRSIQNALAEHNPGKAMIYKENAEEYILELKKLRYELKSILRSISTQNRILITTEAAFVYFAKAFSFIHDGVWGTNTEEEGTPQQIKRIIQLVTDKKPQGLFWESTGSPRYMQSISEDTAIPFFGPLYVDSVGKSESRAENYIEMMRSNAILLREVLK